MWSVDGRTRRRRELGIEVGQELVEPHPLVRVDVQQALATGAAAPLGLYLASSAVWLAPLNLNWLRTSVRRFLPAAPGPALPAQNN